MKEFTGITLAETIGVPTQTVDAWVEEFCIPYENSENKQRQYNEEALSILQSIKNLRDQNNGFNTIKQKLSLPESPSSPGNLYISQIVEERLSHLLDEKLEKYLNFTEKFSDSQYRLGQLSEKSKQLEKNNERLKATLKVLPTPDEWFALKEREKMGQDLLFGLQDQLDQLQKELAQMKGTQWPISPELQELHTQDEEELDEIESDENVDLEDRAKDANQEETIEE